MSSFFSQDTIHGFEMSPLIVALSEPPGPSPSVVPSQDNIHTSMLQSTNVAGKSPLVDEPHSRDSCPVHPFEPGRFPLNSHCPDCLCFVCSTNASRCTRWFIHCHATRTSAYWNHQREAWAAQNREPTLGGHQPCSSGKVLQWEREAPPRVSLQCIGNHKKRERDDGQEDVPTSKLRNREERLAEWKLKAMTCKAREHCARCPYWDCMTWVERLDYAKNPDKEGQAMPELAARQARLVHTAKIEAMSECMSKLAVEDSAACGSILAPEDNSQEERDKAAARRLRTAEVEESRRPLPEMPRECDWVAMEVKLGRFLKEACIESYQQVALNLMQECLAKGRATLLLRQRLRCRSRHYNPYKFAITILAPLAAQFAPMAAKVYAEWCKEAQKCEQIRSIEYVEFSDGRWMCEV